MPHVARALTAFALLAAVACKGREEAPPAAGSETGTTATATDTAASREFKVAGVMIGKRIGENKLITEPTFQFTPKDTVHVSVAIEGTGNAGALSAAWRSQNGEILQQSSAPAPAPGANAAFHFSRPEGLRPGTYKVIVFLGADSVETKVFVVKK